MSFAVYIELYRRFRIFAPDLDAIHALIFALIFIQPFFGSAISISFYLIHLTNAKNKLKNINWYLFVCILYIKIILFKKNFNLNFINSIIYRCL